MMQILITILAPFMVLFWLYLILFGIYLMLPRCWQDIAWEAMRRM